MSLVFYVVALVLLLIFVGVQPRLREVPCEDTLFGAAQRPLLHGNWNHLLVNIAALGALAALETRNGSGSFALLLLFLFAAVVLFDWLLPASLDGCSIGFSGVVLGVLVWDGFERGRYSFSTATLLSLLWILVVPVMTNSRISFWGHLYGIIAGLLAVALARAVRGPSKK